MADLVVLFTTLTVFGAGVAVADFLGVMDHFGNNDAGGGADEHADHAGDPADHAAHDVSAGRGSSLLSQDKHAGDRPGIRAAAGLMNILRGAVYFSLGFGPTGLFAHFTGVTRTSGIIWACAIGTAMVFLSRILKRLTRRDLDSSIKPGELLQEEGTLLLPLEGSGISKAAVRQFGREIEIYVRCKDTRTALAKGKKIIIDDYDNDVYWVKPAE